MKSAFECSNTHGSKLTDSSPLEEVDAAMRSMDFNYNTQFYSWIHNENNVDYIAYYMRKIISDYEETNLKSVYRAIKWLVDEWSVQRTAELLVKLFYHWGINSSKFAQLIAEVVDKWSIKQTIELVVTLVIGERSSKVAQFINHLTISWSTKSTVELVRSIGIRLRWNERYFKHFLFQYVSIRYDSDAGTVTSQAFQSSNNHNTRMAINHIRQRFQARRMILQQQHYIPSDTESLDSCFSLVEFSTAIFEKIVSRSLDTLEIPLRRPEPSSTMSHLKSKNMKYPYHNRHLTRLPFYPNLDKREQGAGPHVRSLYENTIHSHEYALQSQHAPEQYEHYSHYYANYSGASTSSSPSPSSSASSSSTSLLEKLSSPQQIAEVIVAPVTFDEVDQNSM
ncbi:hypothetical protein K7432_003357 [Basidiobolus ranarum]|uniref:Uncharacterized protein n=1 Tax=Basidiobolus ranarum TaxID=34480 RepID=A0ABR2WZY0_9FUNG